MNKSESPKITLKECRINSGLKLSAVSKIINKTERTLINWENGIFLPDEANLDLLSKIYGMPKDFIFLGNKFALSEHYLEYQSKNIAKN